MMLDSKSLNLDKAQVMAIVNLTPDSFYATSRHFTSSDVSRSVERAISEGATIVDLGGYSSRPGAEDVSLEEEWRRVRMGLEAVRSTGGEVLVSIDTFRSEVVRRAYEEFGNFIVNDISAGELDSDMLSVVARHNLVYVAMHMRGVPQTMSSLNHYESGVVEGVNSYFATRVKELEAAGIARDRIILDPGFGFGKTREQNFAMLDSLEEFAMFDAPLLVGVSRKSMITKTLDITPEEALNGTSVLNTIALMKGAHILRVHDVKPAAEAVKLVAQMKMNTNAY
jgi:dihydropteroate synthase